MGRPVFKPPYGNFFLSAGCKHVKRKSDVSVNVTDMSVRACLTLP